MKMSQRDITLNKYIGLNLSEDTRDAIHDAMKEHAIEFLGFISKNGYTYSAHMDKWSKWEDNFVDSDQGKQKGLCFYTMEQLYNKFNLNK